MKRMDYSRRMYLLRIEQRLKKRKTKKRRRELQKKVLRTSLNTIKAPQEFRIDEKRLRQQLIDFLTKIRSELSVGHGRNLTIDFTDTHRMWASATLLFKAEICRLKRIFREGFRIRCISPNSRRAKQVLKQTGIYKLFNKKSTISLVDQDVVHWQYANGNEVDGKKYDDVLGSYDGRIPQTVASGLYLGLTEAMTNCHHHAYIASRNDGLNQQNEPKDWWMFSQEKDGWLSVVFCDLGVGIPETLPVKKPSLWEKIKLGRPSDAKIIEEAIIDSKTRTSQPHRGKGLRQLVDVIEKIPQSVLRLYSNHGMYSYENGKVEITDFPSSILGTLVTWRVPVDIRA